MDHSKEIKVSIGLPTFNRAKLLGRAIDSIISQSLGTIGGTVAEKGQKVMSNISVFYPAMGTTIGSGMVIGSFEELIKVGKIKARRKRK